MVKAGESGNINRLSPFICRLKTSDWIDMFAANPCRRISTSVLSSIALGLVCISFAQRSAAADVLVAVATNFVDIMRKLEPEFEQASGHELTLVSGSSGKLFAQVVHGAPFDVYLAADQERPRLLEQKRYAVAGTRFTYAVGRLVLWNSKNGLSGQDGAQVLRNGNFRKLAIANPALAPYGAAAVETLEALELYERLLPRLVVGENVGQAFAMAATGNAELAFVGLSFVSDPDKIIAGSHWQVPQDYYTPIRQDGVLLERAAANPAARELLRWLESAPARERIASYGYAVP